MDILHIVSSNVPATQSVNYSCVLTNRWSGATHPVDYASISGSAHWTAPVLVAHSSDYEVWSPGSLASPGVEAVAEGGVTSILASEVTSAQARGVAGELVIGNNQFNSIDPPQRFASISLTPDFPLLSTISMAGPSPDWFTGLYNYSPVDPTQQFWQQAFQIDTFPWDAGTEKGNTYSINNDPEDPHRPILQLTKNTVPASGILLDPTKTEVLPVATWTCVLDNSLRKLLKEEAPSEAPSSSNRGLLKQDVSEAPSADTRNLLKVESPSEAPTDNARNLLKQVLSEAPTSDDGRNLLKVESPSTAPTNVGRDLLKVDLPSEAPTSDGGRNLLKVESPSTAPTNVGRDLLKVDLPSEAPTSDNGRNLLKVESPSEAPSGGSIRGLLKQDISSAPTIDGRNLLKQEAPSDAPSRVPRGLRGSRN